MAEKKDLSETAQQWLEKVRSWKQSGKSGAQWCREHQQNYKVFCYWRVRLGYGEVQKPHLEKTSFTELTDSYLHTGVEIRVRDISVVLHKNFDSQTLLRCIQTLEKHASSSK